MISWVYLFSIFTPEALLIEALIILILCCSYLIFWVLKKRRFGVIDQEIPSAPVKTYLNELIFNTEQIRAQLFGILSSPQNETRNRRPHSQPPLLMQELDFEPVAQSQGETLAGKREEKSNSAPPEDGRDTAPKREKSREREELSSALLEQTRAYQTLESEKITLLAELAQLRAIAPQAREAATDVSQSQEVGGPNPEMELLKQKLTELEGKLSEYSIIEDDLANLKKLRQENDQLKLEIVKNEQAAALLLGAEGAAQKKIMTLEEQQSDYPQLQAQLQQLQLENEILKKQLQQVAPSQPLDSAGPQAFPAVAQTTSDSPPNHPLAQDPNKPETTDQKSTDPNPLRTSTDSTLDELEKLMAGSSSPPPPLKGVEKSDLEALEELMKG